MSMFEVIWWDLILVFLFDMMVAYLLQAVPPERKNAEGNVQCFYQHSSLLLMKDVSDSGPVVAQSEEFSL